MKETSIQMIKRLDREGILPEGQDSKILNHIYNVEERRAAANEFNSKKKKRRKAQKASRRNNR